MDNVVDFQTIKDRDKITISDVLTKTADQIDQLENIILIREYKDGKVLLSWSKGLSAREIVGNLELMKQEMINQMMECN